MKFEQSPDKDSVGVKGEPKKPEEFSTPEFPFDLGPEFPEPMTKFEAEEEIEKLNKTLGRNEKPWRLPTLAELNKIFEPIEKAEEGEESLEKRVSIFKDIKTKYDFKDDDYWASDELPNDEYDARDNVIGQGLDLSRIGPISVGPIIVAAPNSSQRRGCCRVRCVR